MRDDHPHALAIDQLAAKLETHLERGLGSEEAALRQRSGGANELTERPRPGMLALLWAQFNNYLVITRMITR